MIRYDKQMSKSRFPAAKCTIPAGIPTWKVNVTSCSHPLNGFPKIGLKRQRTPITPWQHLAAIVSQHRWRIWQSNCHVWTNTDQYWHISSPSWNTRRNLGKPSMEDMEAQVKMVKMSAWKALLLRSNSSKPQPCFDCKASCRCPMFRFSWRENVSTQKHHQNRVANVQFILDQTRNLQDIHGYTLLEIARLNSFLIISVCR